ncbi:KaiC domain-containing protein [Pyrobaculum neutrophilum]|uniref:KaiC domain-containing protein n=1 Tax=Pyrobaculum neutrophilum TaxID=70771 RepID=UPI0011E4FF99|nr:KaiC domain-containing protein [Pyrobaculum neutrophilum]
MIPRVRTYVQGLDEILYGGVPERSVVLLSGGPGTGKSILGRQFLYNGLRRGETGVFVALEEHPVAVRRSFRHFGWDISQYEREGKFAIVDAFTGGVGSAAQRERYLVKQVDDVYELSDVLRQAIRDIGARRVVVDSVSTLYLTKPAVARATIMTLKRVIAGLGCTAFFVSQVSVGERGFGGPGVEHAVDGIIRLDLDEIDGKLHRSIIVWKMRDTKHSMLRHPMEIKDSGIEVMWDRYLKIVGSTVKIEPISKEEVEAMRKAVEEVEKQPAQRKVEIEVED